MSSFEGTAGDSLYWKKNKKFPGGSPNVDMGNLTKRNLILKIFIQTTLVSVR